MSLSFIYMKVLTIPPNNSRKQCIHWKTTCSPKRLCLHNTTRHLLGYLCDNNHVHVKKMLSYIYTDYGALFMLDFPRKAGECKMRNNTAGSSVGGAEWLSRKHMRWLVQNGAGAPRWMACPYPRCWCRLPTSSLDGTHTVAKYKVHK